MNLSSMRGSSAGLFHGAPGGMDASWAREVAWRVERRAWMWGGAMTGLYGDGVDIFGGHGDGGVDVGLLDSKLAYIGFGVGQGI
jgi:hypothetical protein